MLIFSITTSTKYLSMSLYEDNKYIANINILSNKSHSKYLDDEITKFFMWNNKKLSDVNVVIISNGPGSFTGIRISQSYIKAVYSDNKTEIYVVDEFLSYYSKIEHLIKNYSYYILIDAQKEKIYANINSKKIVTNLDEVIKIINEDKNEKIIIGDAYLKHIDKFKGIKNLISDEFLHYVDSRQNVKLYLTNRLEKVLAEELSPDYLEKI